MAIVTVWLIKTGRLSPPIAVVRFLLMPPSLRCLLLGFITPDVRINCASFAPTFNKFLVASFELGSRIPSLPPAKLSKYFDNDLSTHRPIDLSTMQCNS